MENYEMSSLDLRFLVKELKSSLANGYIRKIYQYEIPVPGKPNEKTHQFLFEVFAPGKGQLWLYVDKNRIFITTYRKPSPSEPPGLCQMLRKHMEATKIVDVRQHGFDRIVEIETANNVLIIELFSDGNLVLCDTERKILMPLYTQDWKDRVLRPKVTYAYPPARINPFAVSFEYMREYLSPINKKIIAVLAAGMGFGPLYAKEICLLAKIDADTPAERLSPGLCVSLFNTIREIDNFTVKPTIYENAVAPFELQNPDAGSALKQTDSFYSALDEFYMEQQITEAENYGKDSLATHREKYGRMLNEQSSSMKKWEDVREQRKSMADLIYNNYAQVQGITDWINKMKESGLSWDDIKAVIKELPDGKLVKEIRESKALVILEIEGSRLEIDFRRTVMENAQAYYERSKFAKKKIIGVSEAMEKTKNKMEEAPKIEAKGKLAKVEKKDKKWFEKFRWFISSDGFLIVGGKDATSNEVLVKKYAGKSDLVLHSDIQGSPFVVIRAEGKAITDVAKKEAAEFTASYSKAWQAGVGTIDVYCIKPEQVSKQAQPGEYLPKGSFMIYGEREWLRGTELRMAIGVKLEKEKPPEVIAGPVATVSVQTQAFAVIRPGDEEAKQLARRIRNAILIKAAPDAREAIERVPIDEIQKFIPAAKGQLAQ
ncbi:MAG: ribosome rescue protein RqcH [Candidatus Aenigmatarchaeota archaeon]